MDDIEKYTLSGNEIKIEAPYEPPVQKPEVANAVVAGGVGVGFGSLIIIIGVALCFTVILIPIGLGLILAGIYLMYMAGKAGVEVYDEQNEKYKSQ